MALMIGIIQSRNGLRAVPSQLGLYTITWWKIRSSTDMSTIETKLEAYRTPPGPK